MEMSSGWPSCAGLLVTGDDFFNERIDDSVVQSGWHKLTSFPLPMLWKSIVEILMH